MRSVRRNKRALMDKKGTQDGFVRVGFSLYPNDAKAVDTVRQKAAELGLFLTASAAARLLIRSADISKISRKEIEQVIGEVAEKRQRGQ